MSWPSLAAEMIWVREVEGHEIFETETSILLLQPYCITELSGEYARKVFGGQHGQVYQDALAHLRDKAFDRLLQELGADYEECYGCPWPDNLSACILDELDRLDLAIIDCAEISRLEKIIIQKIPAPVRTAAKRTSLRIKPRPHG